MPVVSAEADTIRHRSWEAVELLTDGALDVLESVVHDHWRAMQSLDERTREADEEGVGLISYMTPEYQEARDAIRKFNEIMDELMFCGLYDEAEAVVLMHDIQWREKRRYSLL